MSNTTTVYQEARECLTHLAGRVDVTLRGTVTNVQIRDPTAHLAVIAALGDAGLAGVPLIAQPLSLRVIHAGRAERRKHRAPATTRAVYLPDAEFAPVARLAARIEGNISAAMRQVIRTGVAALSPYWCPACAGPVPVDAEARCARRIVSVTTTASGERRMREVCAAETRACAPEGPMAHQWQPGISKESA